MEKIKLKNTKQLRAWLDAKQYIYEVVTDGWEILLTFHKMEDIFGAGIEYAAYLVKNPQLMSLEELEQRGDIPGL